VSLRITEAWDGMETSRLLFHLYAKKMFSYQLLFYSVADPGSLNKDSDPNSGFDDQCFYFLTF
jgi:hypothetical protein